MNDAKRKNLTLEELREAIDQTDQDLLTLLERRYALTAQVADSKQNSRIFRAGREADLIRRLVSMTNLDPLLVETIWRQIIAFSLDHQKKLTIAMAGDGVEMSARFRFGAVANYTFMDDADAVMDAVAGGRADIGILPHWDDVPHRDDDPHRDNKSWWQALAQRRDRGEDVYITALTPLQDAPSLNRIALLAPFLPDASMHDITLVHDAIGVKPINGYAPATPNLLGIIQQP